MFTLLQDLLERWDERGFKRAVDQHHGRQEPEAPLPTEQDLTSYKPYQLLISSYPKLERQLKLAWTGDIKAKQRKESEDSYIFPKLLKTENLEKYQDGFVINQETMRTVRELYELFIKKFHITNPKHSGWFSY